jgi:hypothetical protein
MVFTMVYITAPYIAFEWYIPWCISWYIPYGIYHMVYTICLMVYTIQKWYIPWGDLPDEYQTGEDTLDPFLFKLCVYFQASPVVLGAPPSQVQVVLISLMWWLCPACDLELVQVNSLAMREIIVWSERISSMNFKFALACTLSQVQWETVAALTLANHCLRLGLGMMVQVTFKFAGRRRRHDEPVPPQRPARRLGLTGSDSEAVSEPRNHDDRPFAREVLLA